VAANVFRRLRHDRRTVGMIVMMPIIFMVLFGFAFAGEPKNVDTIVVNMDRGASLPPWAIPFVDQILGETAVERNTTTKQNLSLSDPVVKRLEKSETLSLKQSSNLSWAREELERGRATAVLYIPANYTKVRLAGLIRSLNMDPSRTFKGTPLEHISLQTLLETVFGVEGNASVRAVLYADKSNTQIYSVVLGAVNSAFIDELRENSPLGSSMQFLNVVNVYGEGAEFIDFFAPGIMVLAVTMITVILTIISFVRERNNGTLARLFSSPMTAGELVGGYALAFGVIATLQSIELLALGVLLFHIQIVGSVLLALLLIVLLALGIEGLGILLSTLARNEFQAIQFIPLVMIPALILSGIFWPVESMPSFFKPLSALLPTTYAVNALRSVMVRGWDASEIWREILILVVFDVSVLAAAVVVMREKSHDL